MAHYQEKPKYRGGNLDDLDRPPGREQTNLDLICSGQTPRPGRRTADLRGRAILPDDWEEMTLGQQRRAWRDLMIVFGHRFCGLSERELGRLHGLAHSRVHAICRAHAACVGPRS